MRFFVVVVMHHSFVLYTSSVCFIRLILFFSSCPAFPPNLYCEAKGLCYVPKGLYYDAEGLYYLLKYVPHQSNVPYHLPPSTPLFMGDSGWKVYNRTSFFCPKRTVFPCKTDSVFSPYRLCVCRERTMCFSACLCSEVSPLTRAHILILCASLVSLPAVPKIMLYNIFVYQLFTRKFMKSFKKSPRYVWRLLIKSLLLHPLSGTKAATD